MKKIYIYALTTALVWGAAGCKKFGDTNNNPNATTTPQVGALLTNVEVNITTYATTGTTAISGGQYAQYFAETQYSSVSLYALPQNAFTGSYNGQLYDLQNIINLGTSKNTSTVAKILQQYIFWVLTDSWGDIPYTEALKGLEATAPKYDSQETIYKGILAKLGEAVNEFDGSTISGDIIYNGNVAQWKKAANSLRMLVAIQLSKKVPGAADYAATAFKEALAGGGITSNADNLDVTYTGAYFSPWYNLYNGRTDFGVANTMTDQLVSLADGRSQTYGGNNQEEVAGAFVSSTVGVQYGLERNKAIDFTTNNPTWARILRGDFRTNNNATATIITAAEVALARAEAAHLGWTSENTTAMYNEGIRLSYDQWGLVPAASYYTQSAVALAGNGSEADFGKITLQRWIASFPDGHQAWNIWRKSTTAAAPKGYPALNPAPDALPTSSGKIPLRFIYDTNEDQTNGANVAAARAATPNYGPDAPLWWDVN
ncbi:SusD/RagB family nutrient-binding outer membrane lipoprotein [Mucilaginibacter pedocola]|nr:SusD/RagB family nutrient-binding outer membrane lipoprotein [Mucilaginibacter pedocola]